MYLKTCKALDVAISPTLNDKYTDMYNTRTVFVNSDLDSDQINLLTNLSKPKYKDLIDNYLYLIQKCYDT